MGFFDKKKKPTPADMEFMKDMKDLSVDDEGLDKAFGFMDKMADIDLDEVARESEEMKVKLDFVVFSVLKIVKLLEQTLEDPFKYEENVKSLKKDTDEEFKQKVKPIYENDS